MKNNDITTSNLADFGSNEIKELIKLLTALYEQGLPCDFDNGDVHAMMNKNSGYVFLTNSNYEVAMLNGNDLEVWYNCSNCGHEGFKEDCELNEIGCNQCCAEESKHGK